MRDTDDARTRILNAAERLFAQNGFDATATAAVATAAHVPKGLLFYYFPTKPDLLRALVAERLSLGPIDTDALASPGNPVRALLNLASTLGDLQRESDVLGVIIWREQQTHPEVRRRLVEYRRQLQAVVERVLRASLSAPVTAARLRSAAHAWVAILSMHPVHAAVAEARERAEAAETETPDATLVEMADVLCAGLVASEPHSTARVEHP